MSFPDERLRLDLIFGMRLDLIFGLRLGLIFGMSLDLVFGMRLDLICGGKGPSSRDWEISGGVGPVEHPEYRMGHLFWSHIWACPLG